MERDPTNSFFKFMLGFLTFISVSLALTFAVSSYSFSRDAEEQTAAAFKALVE